MLAPEFFHRIDAVKNVRGNAIRRRLGQLGNVSRMIGARERHHRITVRERREGTQRFVRRARRRNEMNRVQMKSALRGVSDGDVAGVNRVKCATKKGDRAPMPMSAMRMAGRM
jgi:hypothetical protein